MCIADLMGVANEPKLQLVVLTPQLRLQAQLLAALNEECVKQCGEGQEAARETLRTNVAFLNAIAGVES